MSNTTDQMKGLFENYLVESERFESKGVKASAGRARKALSELSKLIKLRRKEIQDAKAALVNAKKAA